MLYIFQIDRIFYFRAYSCFCHAFSSIARSRRVAHHVAIEEHLYDIIEKKWEKQKHTHKYTRKARKNRKYHNLIIILIKLTPVVRFIHVATWSCRLPPCASSLPLINRAREARSLNERRISRVETTSFFFEKKTKTLKKPYILLLLLRKA